MGLRCVCFMPLDLLRSCTLCKVQDSAHRLTLYGGLDGWKQPDFTDMHALDAFIQGGLQMTQRFVGALFITQADQTAQDQGHLACPVIQLVER